jgi:misacylated tRNA(Ala) deacylase
MRRAFLCAHKARRRKGFRSHPYDTPPFSRRVTELQTKLLYLNSIDRAYLKEFDARILRTSEDYAVLDQTLFYPEGGGQESDTGILRYDGGESRVRRVEKKGIIKHLLDHLPPAGTEHVHGILDWERRHANMKMHTAQHLVSGLAYDLFGGARTVGNQLHPDRSRIDFRPAKFTDRDLQQLESEANRILGAKLPVDLKFESRASLEQRVKPDRANLDLCPSKCRSFASSRSATSTHARAAARMYETSKRSARSISWASRAKARRPCGSNTNSTPSPAFRYIRSKRAVHRMRSRER